MGYDLRFFGGAPALWLRRAGRCAGMARLKQLSLPDRMNLASEPAEPAKVPKLSWLPVAQSFLPLAATFSSPVPLHNRPGTQACHHRVQTIPRSNRDLNPESCRPFKVSKLALPARLSLHSWVLGAARAPTPRAIRLVPYSNRAEARAWDSEIAPTSPALDLRSCRLWAFECAKCRFSLDGLSRYSRFRVRIRPRDSQIRLPFAFPSR